MKIFILMMTLVTFSVNAKVRTTYTGGSAELSGTIMSTEVDVVREAVSFEVSYYDANSPRFRSTTTVAFYGKDYAVGLALAGSMKLANVNFKVSEGEVSSFKIK